MKKKINIQLMTIAVIAIFTTMLLVAAVCYDLFRRQILEDLRTYAHLLKNTAALEEIMNTGNKTENSFIVSDMRITVIGGDGRIIYESCADADEMGNHGSRPEIMQAFLAGEGQAVRKSSTLEKSSFYYAVKMEDGSVIRVSKEADSIFSIFTGAFAAIIVITVILIVFCVVIAHFLTKSLVEPIEKIAQNVDNLGEPDTYEELAPFVATIKKQHEDILRNAGIRQEFTANVSHELKTPLTSISGYSELIENGMASDEDVLRFVTRRFCCRTIENMMKPLAYGEKP